jgi:hypothetical protein
MEDGFAVRHDRPDLPIAFAGKEEMGVVCFAHKIQNSNFNIQGRKNESGCWGCLDAWSGVLKIEV